MEEGPNLPHSTRGDERVLLIANVFMNVHSHAPVMPWSRHFKDQAAVISVNSSDGLFLAEMVVRAASWRSVGFSSIPRRSPAALLMVKTGRRSPIWGQPTKGSGDIFGVDRSTVYQAVDRERLRAMADVGSTVGWRACCPGGSSVPSEESVIGTFDQAGKLPAMLDATMTVCRTNRAHG